MCMSFAGLSSGTDASPMRERRPTNPKEGRSFAWTAQRLAELEHEVDVLKARLKVDLCFVWMPYPMLEHSSRFASPAPLNGSIVKRM